MRNAQIAGVCVLMFLLAESPARADKCWGCRKPRLDIPISLAAGTVITPEFSVKNEGYVIFIRTKKKFPFDAMNCMLGLIPAGEPNNCDKEPLLQVDWVIRCRWGVMARGGVHWRDNWGGWADESIDRYIGTFAGESKQKCVLELKFNKDASALNAANPHLIVIMQKATDL